MGAAPDLLRSDSRTGTVVEIIESLMGMDSANQIQLRNNVCLLPETALMSYTDNQQAGFETLKKRLSAQKAGAVRQREIHAAFCSARRTGPQSFEAGEPACKFATSKLTALNRLWFSFVFIAKIAIE